MRFFSKTTLGDRHYYRRFFTLMMPLVIQNTVTNAVNLLDNVMIGQTGTTPMAAVAIVNQLIFVFFLAVFGALSGPSILSTQFVGAKNHAGVRNCFRFKFLFCTFVTILCCAIFCMFPEALLKLFIRGNNAPETVADTLAYGRRYLFIMVTGLPLFTATAIYASTLREYGQTKIPMLASLLALATNLGGNYVLIFGHFGFPAMGISGAAIATVASRVVEAVIVVAYTHRNAISYPFIRNAFASFRLPLSLVKDIVWRGTPLLLNEVVWALGISAVFQCYSSRGLHVVAALNIVFTISNLFKCIFFSIGSVTAVMIGHELGKDNINGARLTMNRLTLSSLCIAILTGALCIICARPLALCYNVEADIHRMAIVLLYITAFTAPFDVVIHNCYFAIRAGGQGFIAFLMDGIYLWCIQVSVCIFIGHHTNMHIYPFYAISNAVMCVKAFLCQYLISRSFWLKKIV